MNEIIQTLPTMIQPMEDNPLHQLFYLLGCNLDYVPIQKYEAFLMGLQFCAAVWFLYWFTKTMYTLLKGFLRGGI